MFRTAVVVAVAAALIACSSAWKRVRVTSHIEEVAPCELVSPGLGLTGGVIRQDKAQKIAAKRGANAILIQRSTEEGIAGDGYRCPDGAKPPARDPTTVRITQHAEDLRGCKALGSGGGSSMMGGTMLARAGRERAREAMREQAASLGADVVLVQTDAADAMGAEATGDAYSCADRSAEADSGCSKDTDCKGERICVERQCADPAR